jgi:hypothetical protein
MKILKSVIPLIFVVGGSIFGCRTDSDGSGLPNAASSEVPITASTVLSRDQLHSLGVALSATLPGPWKLRVAG